MLDRSRGEPVQSLPPSVARLLRTSCRYGVGVCRRTLRFAACLKHHRLFAYSIAYHTYVLKVVNRQFVGLNLGSGGSKIKGFCNIDANPFALSDVVARIDRLKLRANSVGIIYNSHIFEHVPGGQAGRVLAEWYRVLKPDGRLYICVPDLEVLFKVYLDNITLYHTEEGRYLVDLTCGVTYGGQTSKYDYHFSGYSFVTLKDILESVGFKNVQRFDRSALGFAQFVDASYARFEKGKLAGLSISLNVVASK